MSWLMAKVYDRFMAKTEEACLAQWRSELLSSASGRVLEIGAGTGINLEHYPDEIELVVTEPDRHMREELEEKWEGIEAVDARAEQLPFEDENFQTVVSTLVLCSVESVEASLSEAWRVLVPGGQLLFLEHVESEQSGRRRWQHLLEPIWTPLADGCHLTRSTGDAIDEAGFEVVELTRESMRKALPFLRPTIRGRALKPAV